MDRPLKIAMVAACPFPLQRGTPVRVFRMAEALSHRGHDVHVVTYHLGDECADLPFKIHRIPTVKKYSRLSPGPDYKKLLVLDPLLLFKLRSLLQSCDVDLIHAHHYEGLLVSLFAQSRNKRPVIYDAHTLLESELPYYSLGLPMAIKRAIGRLADHSLPNRASHTIAVTKEIREQLIKAGAIAPNDVSVITNGVEADLFRSNAGNGQRIPGIRTLVYSGNFAPYQRIDLLLAAFKEITHQRQDIRLRLVSDWPFDQVEPLSIRLGIRDYIDIVRSKFDCLPMHLANADIALNPRTVCDGIPQKLLNYMAAGKPIVSFEGSAKVIEHGVTGWIVENENVGEFSKGVLQILNDPELAAKLGNNAKNLARREYTWEQAAKKAEAVYDRALNPSVTAK